MFIHQIVILPSNNKQITMKRIYNFLPLLLALLVISCANPKKDKEKEGTSTEKEKNEKQEASKESAITLSKIDSFAQFPNAKLSMVKPESMEVPAGENTFQFKVENYELRNQTSDAEMQGLANSAKGQHVHFILNNGPYDAEYDNEFNKELPVGDHVMLAFLSRSYHMSVKNENSYVIKKLRVGEPSKEKQLDVDFTAPHLFYSRPKGTYSGDGAKKVLLDFFLLNTELEKGGNYVHVTINGNEEFKVTEWAPYAIKGMPMGENTIELELKDKEGNFIEGPFNKVKRTVTLEE